LFLTRHTWSRVSTTTEAGRASVENVGRRATLPGWNLLAAVAGLSAVFLCAGPISDPDVFWHVEAGAYTLHGKAFPFPDPWAYSLPNAHWHSTAWLSELVLAAVQRGTGWAGVVVLRLLLTIAITWSLYRLLVGKARSWTGPVCYTLVVIPITGYIQERPQTASLLFLVWLSARCHAFRSEGVVPRRRSFVLMTYLWALIHGLFVLAPACLGLLALGALLSRGRAAMGDVRRLIITAALTTVACALTPMGPRLLLAPLRVGSAAGGQVVEWLPTDFSILGTWGFAAILCLLAVAWARGQDPVPRGDVLWVLAISVFGFVAVRNAGPASILLAPVARQGLMRTFQTDSDLELPRKVVLPVVVLGLAAVTASYLRWPVLPTSAPARIARVLAAQPGQLRVLDDYNVSGYLVSSASPHVKLVIDGRADRYGHHFVEREGSAIQAQPHWQQFVDEFHPDVAVIGKDGPLSQLLVATRGWHVVLTDHAYQLLAAPGVRLTTP
jgi:hypothetical protein